jgi:hypothetical protein
MFRGANTNIDKQNAEAMIKIKYAGERIHYPQGARTLD